MLDFLFVSGSLFNFAEAGGCGLPSDFTSLMYLKRVVDF
jgi:hypothetical protein